MRIVLLLLLLQTPELYSQDRYMQAIDALKLEWGYETISTDVSDPVVGSAWTLQKLIAKCVTELDSFGLSRITEVRHTEIKAATQNGHDYLSFIEFSFVDDCELGIFLEQLEADLRHNQFCISKGGVTWWSRDNKIYFFVTRAYYMTYKYPQLLEAINPYF